MPLSTVSEIQLALNDYLLSEKMDIKWLILRIFSFMLISSLSFQSCESDSGCSAGVFVSAAQHCLPLSSRRFPPYFQSLHWVWPYWPLLEVSVFCWASPASLLAACANVPTFGQALPLNLKTRDYPSEEGEILGKIYLSFSTQLHFKRTPRKRFLGPSELSCRFSLDLSQSHRA